MSNSTHSDPAERSPLLRLFYRDWRPTSIGRWVNRLAGWWSGLGLSSREMAVLEVRGRASGRRRSTPVVIATVEGKRYLVSMLGPGSDWVKNVEASRGDAVLRQGRRRPVHLVGCAAGREGTHPQRVRAGRDERPPPPPGGSRRAAVRVPDDRRELSGVRDRSFIA
jgi:hypothetical protein